MFTPLTNTHSADTLRRTLLAHLIDDEGLLWLSCSEVQVPPMSQFCQKRYVAHGQHKSTLLTNPE